MKALSWASAIALNTDLAKTRDRVAELEAGLNALLDACDGNDHEPFCNSSYNNKWHAAQAAARALLAAAEEAQP